MPLCRNGGLFPSYRGKQDKYDYVRRRSRLRPTLRGTLLISIIIANYISVSIRRIYLHLHLYYFAGLRNIRLIDLARIFSTSCVCNKSIENLIANANNSQVNIIASSNDIDTSTERIRIFLADYRRLLVRFLFSCSKVVNYTLQLMK